MGRRVEGRADHLAEDHGNAARLARHPRLQQVDREQPVLRRRAGIGVAHRAAPQRGRGAGRQAEARRQLQRRPCPPLVVSAQAGNGRRRADHPPGAMRMRRRPQPHRMADPRAGLVAGDDGREQRLARGLPRRGLSQRRRHGMDRGMPAGRVVALVQLHRGAGEAGQEGRHRRRRRQPRAEQRHARAGLSRRHGPHLRLRLPGDDGAERVGQDQPGMVADLGGDGHRVRRLDRLPPACPGPPVPASAP